MVLVFLAAGRCFARAGDSLINQRRLNVDVLDALATLAAHKANLPRATNAAVEPVPAYSLAPRR